VARDAHLASVSGFEVSYIGRLVLTFELPKPARSFGPGGLQLPLRFVDGSLTGAFGRAGVVHGTDWASITGAGLIRHCGDVLLALEDERLHVVFRGISQGPEEIVDVIFDQTLPISVPCRLWLQVITESRHASRLDRRLLVGLGEYDFRQNELHCDVLSVD
jgi:hypothetical protein